MTETQNGSEAFDLTREQSWVLHAAVVAAVDRETEADREPTRELELLERVEADAALADSQLELARQLLVEHLDDAPARDQTPGRAALRQIRSARA